jgi:hypothetical protein
VNICSSFEQRRLWLLPVWLLAGLAVARCGPYSAAPPADTLFLGRFVTLNPERPEVEAVAVRAGRILAAGTTAEVEPFTSASTRKVVVDGVALPGLADAHVHVAALGEQLESLDLRALTKDQVLELVRRSAAATPAGTWIRGRGWDQGFWKPSTFPTAADLDRVTTDHPVALSRIDSHSLWVNSRALALAGVSRRTLDPPGGRVIRADDGRPTGMLVDRAMDPVFGVMPEITREQRVRRVRDALAQYARWGLTSVHDAGADLETIAIYKELLAAGQLPVRLYAMVRGAAAVEHYLARGPEIGLGGGRLTVRSIKVVLDGALGSRGAELSQPYADAPKESGLAIMDDEELGRLVRSAGNRAFQLNAHAIGDRAIRRALDVFAREGVTAAQRYRLEHVSVVDPVDLPRFAQLGIIASMQPNFVGEYSRWAADRVGPARVAWVYPTRDILDSGARIAAGSDYPASDSGSPIATLYCLITRKGADGAPADGWFSSQRVPVDKALELMTSAPAFAAFQEHDLGRLSAGRYADITVLTDDPRRVSPEAVRSLSVRMTIVGGDVTFTASGSD